MQDAFDFAFVLGFQGDDVAAVAHGDDRFLQLVLIGFVGDDAIESVLQAIEGDFQIAADDRQPGAGGVFDFGVVVDRLFDGILQSRHSSISFANSASKGKSRAHPPERALERRAAPQRIADIEQDARLDYNAAQGFDDRLADIARAAHGDIGMLFQQGDRFRRFPLPKLHFFQLGRGEELDREFLARAKRGVGSEVLQDLVQFERGERFFADHGLSCCFS